jgi:hypothetical protein
VRHGRLAAQRCDTQAVFFSRDFFFTAVALVDALELFVALARSSFA